MNNELILGVCDGEELSISHQEQLAHTFVFSGANQTNAFIFEVIVKKIESKEGIIFIQGEKTSLKDTFCEKVRNSVRRDEYIAINGGNVDFSDPSSITNELVQIIAGNKLLDVYFEGPDKPEQTRVFMQCLSDAMDVLRTNGVKHKQCNLITTNVEKIQSKCWLKIINFARITNIAIFNSCGGLQAYQDLRLGLNPMFNIVDELFNASLNQILFNQNDQELNVELSRISGIKCFTLNKHGIIRTSHRNKDVVLNKLVGRQYLLLVEGSISIVDF